MHPPRTPSKSIPGKNLYIRVLLTALPKLVTLVPDNIIKEAVFVTPRKEIQEIFTDNQDVY